MKKLITMGLAVIMMMSMAACGGAAAPASSATESSSAPESSAPASSESAGVSSSSTGEADASTGETPNIDRIKAAGKISMLTNLAFPPFEYVGDDGEPAGVDVDVSKEIAKDLGVELEVINIDFGAIIPSLQAGKGDFSAAGMTVSPDRQEQVDFTINYTTSAQYVIRKVGTDITNDLAGKRVAVQESTTGDIYVSDNFPDAEVIRFKSGIDAGNALRSDKCDAVVIDKLPAETIAANSEGDLEVLPEALTEESYAIAVKKDSKDLLDAINATLQRLVDEGTVDSLITTHMTQA